MKTASNRTHRIGRSLLAAAALLLLAGPVTAAEMADARPFTLAQGTTPTGTLSDTTSGDAVSTPSNGVAADAPLGTTESIQDSGSSSEWSGSDTQDFGSGFDLPADSADSGGAANYGDRGGYDADEVNRYDSNDDEPEIGKGADWLLTALALIAALGILAFMGYFVWQSRNAQQQG